MHSNFSLGCVQFSCGGEEGNKLNLEKKRVWNLTILFMMLYLVSYITRINYGAVISEIVKAEGILKSRASLALTASAVTYGAGQIISGFFGDRIEPKKLILAGLITTMTTNLLLPFCTNAYQMTACWGVNGLAQAFMWPPLVRIMTSVFKREEYNTACMIVACASSLGTILVYAVSPVLICLSGWKSVFFASAACAMMMAVVWRKCPAVARKDEAERPVAAQNVRMSRGVCVFIGFLLVAIAMQGILRDGVTTWMPSYISETFALDNKIAILTGVILPIFSVLVTQATALLYKKVVKNEMLLAGLIFALGCLASLLLYVTNGISPILAVALSAVLTGCMHGVNWVVTCMMPPKFGKYGKISFMSGLLNSGTYIGSSISVYGIALFSEKQGWHATLLVWVGVALAGTVLCLALSPRAKKL